MSAQPRCAAGAPDGGQFAVVPRSESGTSLTSSDDSVLIARLASAGIPAHGHGSMPVTYHRPRHVPDGEFRLDDRPDRSMLIGRSLGSDKPSGALWSAPGRRVGGEAWSAWSDWVAGDGYGEMATQLVPLMLKPGGVVVRIDTADDAQRLAEQYPAPPDEYGRFGWAAMRDDGVDGVWLTTRGVAAVDGVHNDSDSGEDRAISSFYAWDASSVAWLSTRHLTAGELVPVGAYRFEMGQYGRQRAVKENGYGEYDEGMRPVI
ncbi:hypothetical protein GCM10027059_50390 [Myceligenerans halotolerans]